MNRMTRLVLVGFVVGFCAVQTSPAYAQDPIHKMGRGIGNLLTGWLELPRNIHMGTLEQNPVLGAGVGLLRGAGLTVTRLLVGAYETVTFFVAYPKDFASPYEGMELPDFAWE